MKSFGAYSQRVIRRVGRSVVRAVFPPVCLSCEQWVTDEGGLCVACWSKVQWIEAPFCEALGTPLPPTESGVKGESGGKGEGAGKGEDQGEGTVEGKRGGAEGSAATYSLAALSDPPPFRRCRTAAHYQGTMRELIHQFKFKDRLDLAQPMARWMQRAGHELLDGSALLVPVPLHRRRLWSRRYNQAALLAEALADLTGCDHAPLLLRRVKRTRQQIGLSAEARRQNVGGAFQVAPQFRGELEGRHVVLIDDVITTGSTVRAATRALVRGGAGCVDVMALAQVCGPGDDDLSL